MIRVPAWICNCGVRRNRAARQSSDFERPEDQIRMLAGFPEVGQLAFLRKALDDYDEALDIQLAALTRAWSAGDVEALDRIGLAPMRAQSTLMYRTIITERNARWAARLRELLNSPGKYFVAVGSLHLAGRESVQNILAREGVKLERVR